MHWLHKFDQVYEAKANCKDYFDYLLMTMSVREVFSQKTLDFESNNCCYASSQPISQSTIEAFGTSEGIVQCTAPGKLFVTLVINNKGYIGKHHKNCECCHSLLESHFECRDVVFNS